MITKEHIEQAKRDTIQIYDDLLENLEHVIDLRAKFVDNGILVTWNPFQSEEADLYFYAEEIHDEWEHSVMKYIELHEQPFDTQSGERLLGTGNDKRDQYTWHFKLVADEREEIISIKKPNSSDDGGGDQDETKSILGRNWNWKKVFTPNDVSGTKRIKATGYAEYEDDLYLMINSRPTSGPRSQTGSLVKTDLDEFEWLGEVLNETDQDWQGTQRVMPACLYRIDHTYYTYFIDKPDHWNGEYWGGRAIGLATSTNLRDWNYYDKPVFSAETFYNLTGLGDKHELQNRGQVYIWGGWVYEGWQYFFIDGSVLRDGSDHELGRICVRHNGDLNWEKVDCDYRTDSAPIQVDGKWYRAWKSKKDGKRSIGIYESDEMLKGYELAEHVAVDVQSTGAIVHPQLISYKGRFAVTWSEYDGDGQNLFISVSD